MLCMCAGVARSMACSTVNRQLLFKLARTASPLSVAFQTQAETAALCMISLLCRGPRMDHAHIVCTERSCKQQVCTPGNLYPRGLLPETVIKVMLAYQHRTGCIAGACCSHVLLLDGSLLPTGLPFAACQGSGQLLTVGLCSLAASSFQSGHCIAQIAHCARGNP